MFVSVTVISIVCFFSSDNFLSSFIFLFLSSSTSLSFNVFGKCSDVWVNFKGILKEGRQRPLPPTVADLSDETFGTFGTENYLAKQVFLFLMPQF